MTSLEMQACAINPNGQSALAPRGLTGPEVTRRSRMAQSKGQQGTGKQRHKDTQEPTQNKDSDGGKSSRGGSDAGEKRQATSGGSGGQSSRESSDSSSDLKSREYRDEQGNVHHHTRTYMEQHGGKGEGGGSRKS